MAKIDTNCADGLPVIGEVFLHGLKIKLIVIDIEETSVGAHALLITSEGKVILQKRDDNPEIVNPGMISMFGGTSRKGDSPKVCLRRELAEELELDIALYDAEMIGVFYKTKNIDGVDYEANVFAIPNVEISGLRIHEGKDLVCGYPTDLLKMDDLTRITRLALLRYIEFNGQHKFR